MATSTSHLPPTFPALTSRHHLHLHPSPPPPLSASVPRLRFVPLRAARRRHPDVVVVVPDARPWVGDLSGSASYRDGSDEDEDDAEEDEDRSLDLLAQFLHSVFRKASRRARRAARSVLPPSVPAELVKFSVNGVLVLTFLWILKGLLEIEPFTGFAENLMPNWKSFCAVDTPIKVTTAENKVRKKPAVAFIGIWPVFCKILIRATLVSFWEVVCTFGSMVFASILLVRGIWSGVTYIRESRYSYIHQLNNHDNRWGRVQTAG